MRRLVAFVVFLTMVPATAAMGTDLDELLDRGHEASYSAEQIISCSTPDGVRDAVVRITQTGKDLTVSSSVTDDVEIAAGAGSWSLHQSGGLVAEAAAGVGPTTTLIGLPATATPYWRPPIVCVAVAEMV